MAVAVHFALYDTLRRAEHAQYPWPHDEDESGRAARFISVLATDDAPGLTLLHGYQGFDAPEHDGDYRRDPPELFIHGSHEINLRGIRLVGAGDWPPGKQFGIKNPGDESEWMQASSPPGAVRYRVFRLVMPTFNSIALTDALWSFGGVDDGSAELVHLAAQAVEELS